MASKEHRCSSLPKIMACPASAQQTGPAIDVVSEAGQMGTAVHTYLKQRTDGRIAICSREIAEKYGVDATELVRLADIGWEMCRQIELAAEAGESGLARPEVSLAADLMPELRLTGHLDYLIRVGTWRRATVVDYKTGRRGDLSNPEHQLKGYMWLVLACFPEIGHVTGVALWLHERASTTYQMAREEADAWRDELVAKLTDPDPKYGPSESVCRYCPYQATCEARLALLSGALAVIDGSTGEQITHCRLLAAYTAASAIEARLKHFRTELRARIFRDGPIRAAGLELSLQEASVSEIDPQRAWPVLAAHLSEDEIAQCVTLGKGKLVKHIRAHVAKGKQAAEDSFLTSLSLRNAITYVTQHRLTLRTVEEE